MKEYTEEELSKVSEHRFFVKMSLKNRLKIKRNMDRLRAEHRVTLSDVLRKVMLERLNDENFLKDLGVLY